MERVEINGTVLVHESGSYTCALCGNVYESIEAARPNVHGCEGDDNA